MYSWEDNKYMYAGQRLDKVDQWVESGSFQARLPAGIRENEPALLSPTRFLGKSEDQTRMSGGNRT